MRFCLFFLLSLSASSGFAAKKTEETHSAKVKYKQGKDLNFEGLVVEGQIQRPDIAVVTGDTELGSNGMLRLREDFVDHALIDAGGEVQ